MGRHGVAFPEMEAESHNGVNRMYLASYLPTVAEFEAFRG